MHNFSIPVVSITIWSNFPFFLLTNSPIILTRSPLTVQHKHPLLSITMSSAPIALAATKEPSMSTSPNCHVQKEQIYDRSNHIIHYQIKLSFSRTLINKCNLLQKQIDICCTGQARNKIFLILLNRTDIAKHHWCNKSNLKCICTSFSITAIRFPWSAVNIWFNNVVCHR